MHSKSLLFLALVAAVPLASACGSNGDDDSSNLPDAMTATPDARPQADAMPAGTAQLDVTWNLTALAGDACPADGTVEVISQPTTGPEYVDLYDCVDGEGVTAPLPLGSYTVWVNVVTSDDLLWAQSFSQTIDLDTADATEPLVFDILTDQGYMYATWTLTEQGTNAPLTCAEVGADGVSILSTLVGEGGMAYDDVFSCVDGEGTTAPLPLGDYTVVTTLLDDQDAVLGQSEPRDVALEFGNELEDLGNFEFTFEP